MDTTATGRVFLALNVEILRFVSLGAIPLNLPFGPSPSSVEYVQ